VVYGRSIKQNFRVIEKGLPCDFSICGIAKQVRMARFMASTWLNVLSTEGKMGV
jgi:hypothetical protein